MIVLGRDGGAVELVVEEEVAVRFLGLLLLHRLFFVVLALRGLVVVALLGRRLGPPAGLAFVGLDGLGRVLAFLLVLGFILFGRLNLKTRQITQGFLDTKLRSTYVSMLQDGNVATDALEVLHFLLGRVVEGEGDHIIEGKLDPLGGGEHLVLLVLGELMKPARDESLFASVLAHADNGAVLAQGEDLANLDEGVFAPGDGDLVADGAVRAAVGVAALEVFLGRAVFGRGLVAGPDEDCVPGVGAVVGLDAALGNAVAVEGQR